MFALARLLIVGLIVLTIPIFFPVAVTLGYDPLWFGVTITVITTLGAVTPPVSKSLSDSRAERRFSPVRSSPSMAFHHWIWISTPLPTRYWSRSG